MEAPSEKHLQDWIWNYRLKSVDLMTNPDWLWLDLIQLKHREYVLPSGIADFIATTCISPVGCVSSSCDHIYIIETKKQAINARALAQILRYMNDVKAIWASAIAGLPSFRLWGDPFCEIPKVAGMLVGYSVDPDILLAAQSSNIDVVLYEWDEDDGYTFYEQATEPLCHPNYLSYSDSDLGDVIRDVHNLYIQEGIGTVHCKREVEYKDIPKAFDLDFLWDEWERRSGGAK